MFNQPVQDKVLVKINGQDLTGWTEASITAGIERIPRYGRLSVTWETNQGLYKNGNKPLAPLGLPITVSLGSEKVLTGYMDVSSDRVSEGEHSITYNVRGASCDLVDSTAEFFNQNQQGTLMSELYNVTILQAVSKMSSVYNVNVISTNPLTNTIFPGALNINVGDAAFTEIDYLAKFTGSLIYENANGDLVLGLPGTEPASTTFLTHMNVLSSEFINDITGIYSEYEIFAQGAIENTDIPNLPTNHMSIGAVLDNFFENRLSTNGSHRVRKYRKIQDLTLSSDIYNRNSDFNFNPQQLYAQWLANRNKGHAQCMEVEVFGWRDDAGQLWRPNQMVNLKFPLQHLNNVTWLVTECTYTLAYNGGTTTRLTLMPKEAFSVEPVSIPMDTDVWEATYGKRSTQTSANTSAGFV